MTRNLLVLGHFLLVIALGACGGDPQTTGSELSGEPLLASTEQSPEVTRSAVDSSGGEDALDPPAGEGIEMAPTATTPSGTAETDAGAVGGALEISAFTPTQQEGPYYTVDKPADRDNDLTVIAGAAGQPAGDILEFGGTLYDATGTPLVGVTIEIWQTDANGVYLHPNDPSTAQRDPNFQFYGEAVTGPDGSYRFRTIMPGEYEPRPTHIHFKVKYDGRELLTSQLYFAGSGAPPELLVVLEEGTDAGGNPVLIGRRDIVLSEVVAEAHGLEG